jgi:hypothetical protein
MADFDFASYCGGQNLTDQDLAVCAIYDVSETSKDIIFPMICKLPSASCTSRNSLRIPLSHTSFYNHSSKSARRLANLRVMAEVSRIFPSESIPSFSSLL